MDRWVDILRIYEIFHSIFRSSFSFSLLPRKSKADSKSEDRNSIVQRDVRVLFRGFSCHEKSSKISGHVTRFPTQLIIVHRQILCPFASFFLRFIDFSSYFYHECSLCLPIFIDVILSGDLYSIMIRNLVHVTSLWVEFLNLSLYLQIFIDVVYILIISLCNIHVS